jgi:flagellar hook-associated protein 2
MAVRMTGLISGLDTESMVNELVSAQSEKVDKIKQNKQKVEWKKEIWQGLNTKIYDFYKNSLASFKTNGSYTKKKAVANDETKVSVTAGSGATNGTHTVSVTQMASSAYLTGANIKERSSSYTTYNDAGLTTKFEDMKNADGSDYGLVGETLTFSTDAGESISFTLGGSEADSVASLSELNEKLAADDNFKGLKASIADGKLTFTNSSAVTADDGTVSGTVYSISSNLDSAAAATEINYKADEATGATTTYSADFSAKVAKEFTSSDISKSTKLSDLGIAVGTTFTVKGQDFVVDANSKISDFTAAISKMGVSASFDETQGRFYINASATGEENNFDITSDSADALNILGLDKNNGATKVDATDAIITYNGVQYKGSSNTFSLNGLSITAKAVTTSPINVEVSTDVDSAYQTVKDFVNAYNTLIDELNTYYNEDTTDYDPLTDDEKSELSDTQIEQWEKKAKQGLLRRDSTLESLLSNMRTYLNQGVTVTNSDGTTSRMSLSSLGIVTGDYSENGKLHILGDEDDSEYSSYTNTLKETLSSNPNLVAQTLAGSTSNPGLGTQMYSYLTKAMKRVEGSSSSLTFYNDITLDDEIDDYEDQIEDWEDKLADLEDKYYSQFSAMETAMAKLQQQQSALSSLMGS